MAVQVTAKKWGNSLGFIIPKNVVDELALHEGAALVVEFRKPKKTVLEMAYGALKFDEPTEVMLAETRKGWSKWIE